MKRILEKQGFICDMDGVIYHGKNILPGAKEFVNWMIENDKKSAFPLFFKKGYSGFIFSLDFRL